MMFRNMVTSLLDKERISTTLDRAKAVRPIAEKIITLGKRNTLHSRRQALAFVKDPAVVAKLFSAIAPRFSGRNGGYTRIIKLGCRPGDGAQKACLELIGSEYKAAKKKDSKKAAKTGKDSVAAGAKSDKVASRGKTGGKKAEKENKEEQ